MIARTGKMRCSFCGKSQEQVARLIAGPKIVICDECVGICTEIIKATPTPTNGGWESMSDEQLLSALLPASRTVDATRAVLQGLVEHLRERQVSWETIGRALGTSRQAAWERFS